MCKRIYISATILLLTTCLCSAQTLPSAIEETDHAVAATMAGADRSILVVFSIVGTVNDIDDGDTLSIQASTGARFKIRMSDMDTPEVSHKAYTPPKCETIPFRPGQQGGKSAFASLKELVTIGDSVKAECYELDKYGRSVCHVFNGRVNLNLEQIKRGWGWLPSKAEWIRDPASMAAETQAKAAKLGAWSLQGQVHPDDWRRTCWGDGHCDDAE